ncbi:UPF0481 protein At3g47200-like [Cornus florida]|uniref:UPF0481 protein At3g47200-like n=1 Tax=Cornus florida TaxID=4283 RepID=UPI00289BEA25|nr:UPF0481 protein At3g47200-like [Cornus florida]
MANEEISNLDEMLDSLQKKMDENRSYNMMSPMVGELTAPKVHGMYEVPDVLLEQNRDAYTPSCVSIGPFGRLWSEDVKEMEAVKLRYMTQLLERNGTLAATLRECTQAMLMLEGRVWGCYYQIGVYRDITAQMLMIDGCFIIELLYKKWVEMSDPILQNHLKYHQIKRDLLLLENQIPFFVLEELFRLTVERILETTTTTIGRGVTLRRFVISFFGDMMGVETIDETENLENKSPYHILHFLHICYLSSFQKKAPVLYKHREKPRFKYSATKLQSVGVKFGTRNRVSLFDLKFSTDRPCFCFWRRGHFKIPRFSVNDSTESFLRNFIAFEHCCPGIDKYFTSHAVAMSILMDSAEDVKLLEEAGVIRNNLGYSEAVSELFKDITSEEAIVRNQYLLYKDLWMQVLDFCSPWRLAFANVTTQMAVAAVIILNLITLLSSVYTVLSYYRN